MKSAAMDKQRFFYSTLRGRLLGSNERERMIDGILQHVREKDSFLDFGCAAGHYVGKVAGRCARCVGIDIDSADIGLAKKHFPSAEFICGDATALKKLSKGEFDWVLCSEVLEHIPKWQTVLNEIKRVCAKNAVFTIPLEKSVFWRAASKLWPMEKRGHVHALCTRDIEQEMGGFELKLKKFVFAPSRRINERFSRSMKEKYAMYGILWFQRAK